MHLHIVSFDIPWPANYGGVIDVYHKIRALAEQGVSIYLHCFQYGRERADELNLFCKEVNYYPRKPMLHSLPVQYPHIVSSRRSGKLLKRLREDDFPILFEGIHTTYYLSHPRLEERTKLVRMHNIEWEYYYQLGQREGQYWNRQYYLAESRQLQHFENILAYANHILTISPKDTAYYKERFDEVSYLPAFHANPGISSKTGRGKYCLYHAKLSVPENHEAALFLIKEVFHYVKAPLVIAGLEPLPELIALINEYDHITLRHNLGDGEMLDLMREAHIHVLPTFQSTGIKLKLINSLFTGRYVLVNPQMVHQTGLEFSTEVAREGDGFREAVKRLMEQPFTEIELAQRRANLGKTFSNALNAKGIVELLGSLSE